MRTDESEDGTTLDRFVTIFRKLEDGTYRRTDEHHVLRLYEPGEVVDLLHRAGFDVQVLDSYRDRPTPVPGWKVFLATPAS
jgi:hypothetical protein